MERLRKDVQLVQQVLPHKISQFFPNRSAETGSLVAVHLVPLPQTDQNDVIFFVLDLAGDLGQTVQVDYDFILALHFNGSRQVVLVLTLLKVGTQGHFAQDSHRC
mgnify:CR=1 FL=1